MASVTEKTSLGLATTKITFKVAKKEQDTDLRPGRSPYRAIDKRTPFISYNAETSSAIGALLHGHEEKNHQEQKEFLDLAKPMKLPPQTSFPLSRTPSIAIAMSPSQSRSRSRLRASDADDDMDTMQRTPNANGVYGTEKARRKRKKAPKKAAADPAEKTVRGFTPTPVPSTDEDSDFSPRPFRQREISIGDLRSITSSPCLRPTSAIGGISALRQQLDDLNLEPVPGNPALIRHKRSSGVHTPSSPGANSSTGTSDSEPPEMSRYEVPLENDFISSHIDQNDPYTQEMVVDNITRKMTSKDFQPLTCLGKGTFGTVHLVKQAATGRLYAQKMFRKASLTVQKRLVEQTKTERAILESISRHPFVVKLFYAFQDQEKLYLILEYAQGGELFTHLANERMFPEDTAAFYMAEMVLALEHLHRTVGVVYRDLKPENCLLDAEGHLLLTDFGLSKVAVDESDRCNSILGTLEYMAPEILLGHFYGTAVDWWSFGALGFDLLTGSPPFRANNHAKIQEKILKAKLVLPYFLSPDAKDLLTRLLRKEPNKRLGGNMPKDMQVIKKHRFFRKIDWKLLEKRELVPPIQPLVTDPELAENFSSEFTSLAMSPTAENGFDGFSFSKSYEESNPFGGFSYVASSSLLDHAGFL